MSAAEQRVLFACRGSASDGLGHVIRTRAVMEAGIPDLETELVVIGDELATGLLTDLGAPWSIVEDEGALVRRAEEFEPEAVVFDLTWLQRGTFKQLQSGRLTASLSPILEHLDDVDLVFNRTRYARGGQQPTGQGRYYSLDYAVVRPDCRRIDTGTFVDHLDDDGISIAISMGGADAPNRTLEVLEALRPLKAAATFWVILGEGYGHSYHDLVDRVRRDQRHEIILAKTNWSMWRILGNCSLAILAGGITTYEAAYAGLPSINVLAEASDRFLIQELIEHGVAFDGGTFDEPELHETRAGVEHLVEDREELLRVHRASRRLIDGRGAERVIQQLTVALNEAHQPIRETA